MRDHIEDILLVECTIRIVIVHGIVDIIPHEPCCKAHFGRVEGASPIAETRCNTSTSRRKCRCGCAAWRSRWRVCRTCNAAGAVSIVTREITAPTMVVIAYVVLRKRFDELNSYIANGWHAIVLFIPGVRVRSRL